MVQLQIQDFSSISIDEFQLPGGIVDGSETAESGSNGNTNLLETLSFKTIEVNGHPVWQLDDRHLRKDIDHCLTCGCFGLRQEFFKPHYCVSACYYSSSQWLEEQQQLNAPIKLFKQPALPSVPNPFK